MREPQIVLVFLLLAFLFGQSQACVYKRSEGDCPWSYDGATGPTNWGTLCGDKYRSCSGSLQSPIDMVTAAVRDLEEGSPSRSVALTYGQPQELVIWNNGHAIEVEFGGSAGFQLSAPFLNGSFQFSQLHFHRESEHTINTRRFPLEVHFVHSNGDKYAVVSVMFTQGNKNRFLDLFTAAVGSLPEPTEGSHNDTASKVRIPRSTSWAADFTDYLKPSLEEFYSYRGSLTTPPCSETVEWIVAAVPVEASAEQLQAFEHALHNNGRPIQERRGRAIHVTLNKTSQRVGYALLGLVVGTMVLVGAAWIGHSWYMSRQASDFSRLVELEMDHSLNSPSTRPRKKPMLKPSHFRSGEDPEDSEESLATLARPHSTPDQAGDH